VSLARFGVAHPVPMNLMMVALIVAGVACALTMTKEFFPETSPESAVITLAYPGATPEEIEESLARKVEDKVADLDEVEELTTTISEGGGGILVEFRDDVRDVARATDEVEQAVDALTDLPEEAERIVVAEFEPRLPVIMVTIFGGADEAARKRAIERMRNDLESLPGMGEVATSGVRESQIRVDADPALLLAHDLSLPRIADAIRAWMTDVPGGTVRGATGNVNLRAIGVAERVAAIREIPLAARPDGTLLRVGAVAAVRDDFEDAQFSTRFRTREGAGPSVSLTVYKVGDQDAVRIARMVREYVRGVRRAGGDEAAAFVPTLADRLLTTERRRAYELGLHAPAPLPVGCFVETSSDLARFIEGRLDLLLRNAKAGAVLVVLTLVLMLNWRSAFWVTSGLVTALCGTLLFMKLTGVTLNLLTMFGLIIVLGLLVDDAIVVAENIQARHDRGEAGPGASVRGTEEVFWPVVATVATTIVAFVPLTFIKGQIGDLLGALPWVVTCALTVSLIEAVLILPCHMAHSLARRDRRAAAEPPGLLRRLEARRDRLIFERIVPAYQALLRRLISWRYVTLGAAVALLVLAMGLVAGGRVPFTFIAASDSETIIAELEMPVETPLARTEEFVRRIEEAAIAQRETKSISALAGVQAAVDETSGVTAAGVGTHLGQLFIELTPIEERDRESSAVIQSIREAISPFDGAESISFSEIQGGPGGRDVTVRVSGDDAPPVALAVSAVKRLLEEIEGVTDVADDEAIGQREIQIALRPEAAGLGLSVAEVARQVRGALFGLEAHVFASEREDVEVRVRLDEPARRSLRAIESMWIIGPDGRAVPLEEVASLTEGSSFTAIRRVDRRRAVTVSADVVPGTSPESIVEALAPSFDAVAREHGVTVELAGRQRQLRKAFASLPLGFAAALAMIYVILAWLFSSYVQPLAVMSAIPFSVIGVVFGHVQMGYDITFLSLIGFVALSGIVVNDSLILVEFYNHRRAAGAGVIDALVDAGGQRLRAIVLTTVTTVLGLTPLILERSFQAKFLIPMAIAISFGLVAATFMVLLVLPCLLVIVDDASRWAHLLWHGRPREEQTLAAGDAD
jgi:multidrug efflux pump subunit AcrB